MIDRYMIDTNTVSYIVKGRSVAARRSLAQFGINHAVCLSAITEGELLCGLAKGGYGMCHQAATNTFLRTIQVLPWSRDEAAVYGVLREKQRAAGKILESLDMLIAAHALATDCILVTSDQVFAHVAGLRTVNWATDL